MKIVENEIHTDIVPTENLPWRIVKKEVKKKKKRKGVKNVNVLSFGNEFADEELSGMGGMKSSHDLIESKRLSKEVDEEVKQALVKQEKVDSKRKQKEESQKTQVDDSSPSSKIDNSAKKDTAREKSEQENTQIIDETISKAETQKKETLKKEKVGTKVETQDRLKNQFSNARET